MSGALSGRTVVVTRAPEQAGALGSLLEERGAGVLYFPTIAIAEPPDWTPADEAIDRLATYGWCVFTSANAVERFVARMSDRGVGAAALGGVRVVAVGPATAARLRDRGVGVDLVPGDHKAEGVLDTLVADGAGPGDRVLIPRALEARELLPEALREAGVAVDVAPVYRNVLGPGDPAVLERLASGAVDAVTFTSSSTARNFAALTEGAIGGEVMAGLVFACIGPITSKTAAELGFDVSVEPGEYTVPALVDALEAEFASR